MAQEFDLFSLRCVLRAESDGDAEAAAALLEAAVGGRAEVRSRILEPFAEAGGRFDLIFVLAVTASTPEAFAGLQADLGTGWESRTWEGPGHLSGSATWTPGEGAEFSEPCVEWAGIDFQVPRHDPPSQAAKDP